MNITADDKMHVMDCSGRQIKIKFGEKKDKIINSEC